MTAVYWSIGRRIVLEEQRGTRRAEYGEELIEQLARRLTAKFGRGFGPANLWQMRAFYLAYANILQTASRESRGSRAGKILQTASGESRGSRAGKILQTASGESRSARGVKVVQTVSIESRGARGGKLHRAQIGQTVSDQSDLLASVSTKLPLPWSHYVKLLSLKNELARRFYEAEALRGGWTVRQLDRQIQTQFYERTLLSRNKRGMLIKGEAARAEDALTPEDEIKDPFVLEFLGLKDEYSENDLEDALVRDLEAFLLELGGDFTFVGRQRRLRIGDRWFRIDLLFFHRRLRCLVVVDLKLGEFDHADAGQMHLYLNYAKEHWTVPGENAPVGLILCSAKDEAIVKYSLAGHASKVLAAEYRMALPDEKLLADHVEQTRQTLTRRAPKPRSRSAASRRR